jgi:predicted dehydrogenase
MARRERLITSRPLAGQPIPVEVPTHVAGTLELVSGVVVSIAMSFDVARHRHLPLEVHGGEAAMIVPHPNRFGGTVEIARAGGAWQPQASSHGCADGSFRIMGVADMAQALRRGRPHRASGELALHVLEVMEAVGRPAETGRHVGLGTRPERPAALPPGLADGELD